LLTWHTEDAFHPNRADYCLLFAIRNYDRVPTTIGFVRPDELTEEYINLLFQPRYFIRPDKSHLPENNTIETASSFIAIERMKIDPEPVAIFSGDRASPYIRLDPYFMHTAPGDKMAKKSLESIIDVIDKNLRDVVLSAGDLLILDNRRAVHGRRPYQAKYDGRDRWLKRVNVTRDLRNSRELRQSNSSRLVG
jgi:Fe(II)/alpha-ketoglutarate-dependent arginine beta-hydroxylase